MIMPLDIKNSGQQTCHFKFTLLFCSWQQYKCSLSLIVSALSVIESYWWYCMDFWVNSKSSCCYSRCGCLGAMFRFLYMWKLWNVGYTWAFLRNCIGVSFLFFLPCWLWSFWLLEDGSNGVGIPECRVDSRVFQTPECSVIMNCFPFVSWIKELNLGYKEYSQMSYLPSFMNWIIMTLISILKSTVIYICVRLSCNLINNLKKKCGLPI